MAVIVPSSSLDRALVAPSASIAPPQVDFALELKGSLSLAHPITHGIDLDVVAAVVGVATTADQPTNAAPEYRLVNNHKRKNNTHDDDDDDDEQEQVPYGHVAKRAKTNDSSQSDTFQQTEYGTF